MKEKDVNIIIPVLNEEKSLPLVLNHINRDRVKEIVVVDNGSVDKTSEVAKRLGCTVVKEPIKGYGRACLAGLSYLGNYENSLVAFIDGDYSDNPAELSKLYDEIDGGYDFVLGSRLKGKRERGAMLAHAYFGNWLATTLMKLIYPKSFKFTDLGPMRVIRGHQLAKLQMSDVNFGWTIEMQIKAIKEGLKCSEIPVSYKKRIGESKISGTLVGSFKAGVKILFSIWRYR